MDPPFLAVPVGGLIGHDALSDAVTAVWHGQFAGWRVTVDAVDDALSLIAATERSVAEAQRRCARLREAILRWAFEGRLSDQDPSDEPASVLLARIKAERDAAEVTRNNGRTKRDA